MLLAIVRTSAVALVLPIGGAVPLRRGFRRLWRRGFAIARDHLNGPVREPLTVNNEKQYRALMDALGRTDALEDPRFVDWFARKENEPALRAIIEEQLAKKDPREWEKILDAAGAPCASIWKIEEVIDHPQIAARGAIQEIDTPYGRLRFAGSGFRLAHGGGRLDTMAPELGAHTDEVLHSIGYDAEAIADLRAREIV
jgi:crotonobetainyl-CoA:carnitine CoA-transferase CaiB-like acyl-CoA transferase